MVHNIELGNVRNMFTPLPFHPLSVWLRCNTFDSSNFHLPLLVRATRRNFFYRSESVRETVFYSRSHIMSWQWTAYIAAEQGGRTLNLTMAVRKKHIGWTKRKKERKKVPKNTSQSNLHNVTHLINCRQ